MKAVIMAGGRGTRLQSFCRDIPKPMLPIEGRPVLEYQIHSLKKSGITDIIIVTGHLGSVITDYFSDGSRWGVHIEYIKETVPLGTGGSLGLLKGKTDDDFLLLFGDLMLDADFCRFMRFHKKSGALITLFAHPNSHPSDSDLIEKDNAGRVTGFLSKTENRTSDYHNMVNAGIYCISHKLLENFSTVKKLDFEKDILVPLIAQGKVWACQSAEYVKDMGTPERLETVLRDIRSGLVHKRSLRNKQKAVFLDAGSIADGFLQQTESACLYQDAAEAVRKCNASEFLAVLLIRTAASEKWSDWKEDAVLRRVETRLGQAGAYADALFCIPDFEKGQFQEWLKQEAENMNIGLADSWLVSASEGIPAKAGEEIETVRIMGNKRDGDFAEAAEAGFAAAVETIISCR